MSNLTQQNNKQVEIIKRKEKTIYDMIASNMQSIKSSLPKHITAEKMARLCFSTIVRSPQLLNAEASSLLACILEASAIGLEPDPRGLAYIVPYKGKLQLIIGYKGYMELAYRSDKVSQIFAETVHKNDKFEFALGLEPKLIHVPNLDERGELFAVYAVAKMKDGTSNFIVLGKNEIEKSRNASQSANGGKGSEYSPWNTYTEEMWKKTAIKKLCKYLPLSVDIQKADVLESQSEKGEVFDIDFMDISEKQKLNTDMKQLAHDIETEAQKESPANNKKEQQEDLQVQFEMLLADNNISIENGYKFVNEWSRTDNKDVNEIYNYAVNNKKPFLSSLTSWLKDVENEPKDKQAKLM